MPTPTSRRAPAADTLIEERDALCAELIALEREGEPRVTRAAAIEARLTPLQWLRVPPLAVIATVWPPGNWPKS